MGTKTYNAATDMITFSRASGGTALRKVSYGNELVTGVWATPDTFDNTTSVTGASVTATGGTTATRSYVDMTTVAGKTYSISAALDSSTEAAIDVFVREGAGGAGTILVQTSALAVGSTVTATFTATTTQTNLLLVGAVGSDFVVSGVSVKEVTFDQADGTLELFNHPDDVPRIEYDAAGAVKGLLIEEARTNLITYSSDLFNADWFRNSGVAPSAAINQLGLNMTTLTDANATSFGNINNYLGSTLVPSTVYTMSGYVARNPSATSQASIRVQQNDSVLSSQYSGISIDPTDGTFGNSSWTSGLISRNVVPYGPDLYFWYVTFTTTANITTSYCQVFPAHYDLSGGSGASVVGSNSFGGLQIENGGFPSSYIPTTGAAATRAADVATIPTSAFGYNSEGGTVVVDFNMSFDGTNYARVWEIGSTINNQDRINLFGHAPIGKIGTGLFTAGVSQGGVNASTGNTSPVGPLKVAFAWRENDLATVQDGGAVLTDSVATITGGNPRTVLALGAQSSASVDFMNGHIKSIQYYPRRLTNAQLQELTT